MDMEFIHGTMDIVIREIIFKMFVQAWESFSIRTKLFKRDSG